MAYKCNSCNKFASVEMDDPDEIEVQIDQEDDDSLAVSGNVTLTLTTSCCGDQCADAQAEFEETIDISTVEHEPTCKAEEREWEVEAEDAETSDRYDGDAKTPMRYRRHYYGATFNLVATCTCGAKAHASASCEVAAGEFDQV